MAAHKQVLAWLALAMALVAVSDAAMSCGTVVSNLTPCLGYLRTDGSGAVPAGCCSGIRSLNTAAQTTVDRQTVCGCLKSAAQAMGSINMGLAGSMPNKCGVNIPYKIDPSTDCSKVQ